MGTRVTRTDVDTALAPTTVTVRTTRTDVDTALAPTTVTVRTTRTDVDVLILISAAVGPQFQVIR